MLCAALALPLSRRAAAYNLDEGASWSGAPSLPIQVHLGAPSTLGGVAVTYPLGDGFATFDDSFIQAIRLWNHYLSAGPGPVMTPTVGSGAGSQNDGINTMFFSSTVFGQAFGSNTLAVTVFDNIGSQMTEADIMFNTAKRWDSYRGNPHFVG